MQLPQLSTGFPRHVLVIAAPATPNGDLHVGHLAGPYLAGDVYTRFLRLCGDDVYYVSGTDDHQGYVQTKALQLGIKPQETADLMAGKITATLKAARIEIECFVRPSSSLRYKRTALETFRSLYARGELIGRQEPNPFCKQCCKYVYEGSILGRCPQCGCQADGAGCVSCGYANHGVKLLEAYCGQCGTPTSYRLCGRLYFPLHRYSEKLGSYWERVSMSPGLRLFCERSLAAGLSDIAVTQVGDWGLPVPIAGFEGQTIFPWFEEVAFCLSYPQQLGHDWEYFWKSEEAAVVQCFGFDNAFYQAVFAPALMMAYDPSIRPPSVFLMNELYLLEGSKFSTSRGHAIWGRDLLEEVPADALRFYLAETSPEREPTSFNLAELVQTVDGILLGEWQLWLDQLAARMRCEFENRVPSPGEWSASHRWFYGLLENLAYSVRRSYEALTFSPQTAARILKELVRESYRFSQAEADGQRVSFHDGERRTAMALELLAAKLLAMFSSPILPGFAESLWQDLGYEIPLTSYRWEDHLLWVPDGQKLDSLAATPYFVSVRKALQRNQRLAISQCLPSGNGV